MVLVRQGCSTSPLAVTWLTVYRQLHIEEKAHSCHTQACLTRCDGALANSAPLPHIKSTTFGKQILQPAVDRQPGYRWGTRRANPSNPGQSTRKVFWNNTGGVGIWRASWIKTMYGSRVLQTRRAHDPTIRSYQDFCGTR